MPHHNAYPNLNLSLRNMRVSCQPTVCCRRYQLTILFCRHSASVKTTVRHRNTEVIQNVRVQHVIRRLNLDVWGLFDENESRPLFANSKETQGCPPFQDQTSPQNSRPLSTEDCNANETNVRATLRALKATSGVGKQTAPDNKFQGTIRLYQFSAARGYIEKGIT